MAKSFKILREKMSPEAREQSEKLFAELREKYQTTEERGKASEARIITDPLSGFPVLDSGDDAPVLTSEMVAEMLADFP